MMWKVWINQELKRSTGTFLALFFLFLSCQAFLVVRNTEQQKQTYIDIIGGIFSKTIEKAPELESDLIPLISGKQSSYDHETAKNVLAEYGITEDLSNQLFPNITLEYNVLVLSFVFGCLIFLADTCQYTFFFRKIKKLTSYTQHMLDHELPDLAAHDKEGDLDKLTNELAKIRNMVQNHLDTIEKEKQYLVELLQNISHQFKTKLTTLNLYNDILLNRVVTDEQRKQFLEENHVQIQNMNTMTQNILKLARLDANVITFCKKEESLNQTIREVVDSLNAFAANAGVRLIFQDKESMMLTHDKMWLKEGLGNIIKNCIEHTGPEGMVQIELMNTPVCYRVMISDTGEGMEQEETSKIFTRFYKSKSSINKDSVGIGLSIAKSIMESHNGYIDVKSTKGVGTCFTISFLK